MKEEFQNKKYYQFRGMSYSIIQEKGRDMNLLKVIMNIHKGIDAQRIKCT